MAKGSKTCLNCKSEVSGPRTKICPACSTPFSFTTNANGITENENGETVRKVFRYPDGYDIPDNSNLLHIHIPSGSCPIKLNPSEGESFPSDDTIMTWAGNVRQHMINRGEYHSNKALTYWARQQLNSRSEYSPRGDEMVYLGMVIDGMPDITTKEVPV